MYRSSSQIRRSNSRSVQSSGRESRTSWKEWASAIQAKPRRSRSAEEDLLKQEQVQGDDQTAEDRGDRRQPGRIGHAPHHVATPRDQHQRNQREGDPEREDDLAHDERIRGVEPDPENDQRGREGDGAADKDRDPAADE